MQPNGTELAEVEVVTPADISTVYLQDKASIDIQVSTAHAFPRNIKRATNDAIALVTMDIEVAKTCTYSVPRGGKAITGPSVHLAKIIAQVWGNMRVESKVVDIDSKHVTSESVCWDLQSNLAMKAQVKRSIVGKTGRFSEDMITVTGNAANSIALRNAVFSVVPRGVVDMVYNAAKQKITGDVSDATKLIAKRKQVLDGLKDTYGVTEKEILSAIGKAAVDHVGADDLVVLIGIGTAIKDGDTTVEEAFKGGKKGAPAESVDKEAERIALMIQDAKTMKDLAKLEDKVKPEQMELFNAKAKELQAKGEGK